jgi:hypothetical protein
MERHDQFQRAEHRVHGAGAEGHRVPSIAVARNGIDATGWGRVPQVSMPVEANLTRSRALRTQRTASWQFPSIVITS